jgi:aspartyl-tRNA(Asn)/glutamyl-tRNA(Gln) amidotransferase subunit B
MEEGSLRCDTNISVRRKGETELGTKVEIKNLNSIRNVKRAIESESKRMIELLEQGGKIIQETRSFDVNQGNTISIREKEDADDYRYFAEPDLTPFNLQDEFIEKICSSIPDLPEQRIKKYMEEFHLSEYDAEVLTEEKSFADYFEHVIFFLTPERSGERDGAISYKSAANWMIGPVKSWLNEKSKETNEFPIRPEQLSSIIKLVNSGKISFSTASTKLFPLLLQNPDRNPEEIAKEQNLFQESDVSDIEPIVDNVLEKFADKVTEYKKGKKGLLALFVGEVMKLSAGKADPKIVNEIVLKKIK